MFLHCSSKVALGLSVMNYNNTWVRNPIEGQHTLTLYFGIKRRHTFAFLNFFYISNSDLYTAWFPQNTVLLIHPLSCLTSHCVHVYIKRSRTNTDNCGFARVKIYIKKGGFTLCLCSGISSSGLSQKCVHRAFTKLKIYFWKLLYLYKLWRFLDIWSLF